MKILRSQPSLSLILLTSIAFFCSTSIKAQQVVNGGFEQDTPSSTVVNPGTGWMITNPPGAPYIYSNSFGHGMTPDGNQFLFLTGGTESQVITGQFVIGRTYRLFISAADMLSGTVPTLHVYLTGGSTAFNTFSLPRGNPYGSNATLALGVYELDFVPITTDAITVNMFGDYPIAIDNVFLVPEPSTWALLGLGAAGAGVVRLRRRRLLA